MERNFRKELKSIKGITIIALVITIIILLILAGVSLSAVFSQDGIFSRAEQATDKYGQAKARETLELCLSEAQMRKYESGLTEKQLDEEILKVGSLIPKEDQNSNYQLVIVEGHIFEIDRSIPKIVDYKGPADGIIITAKITQNGDWENPVATVTGTITKYGGGSVVSSIVTATEGVTITDFPTTGGSYTIPNIEKDTDITITASADDGKPAVTKTIKVRLIRDNTPPIISDAKAEATLMKIKISAKAIDSESGLQSLRYSISPATIKDGKAEGPLNENGTPIEIETTAIGNYTVTFTAKDEVGNLSTVTAGPVTTTDAISVEEAKRLVTDMVSLQEYVGTKVDYKTGETWQIFYYDDTGDFGPANTLYLKKAWTANDTTLTLSTKTENTDPAVAMMRRMNPKWANSSYSEVYLDNEKACVWLCDTSVWNMQRNSTYSSYAIGSPSVEMYMKAYNVWKSPTANKDANNLVCKIDSSVESFGGYLVGASGSYANSGYYTNDNTIEAGPGNIFMASGSKCWLATFSGYGMDFVLTVSSSSESMEIRDWSSAQCGVCPVVPLDL